MKEMTSIRMEIIEMKIKTIQKINRTKRQFLEKLTDTVDKLLARLTKRREREQERKFTLLESNEVITTNFTETKITIKEYYERLYANKLDK